MVLAFDESNIVVSLFYAAKFFISGIKNAEKKKPMLQISI
jgi:hypothetical protein